MFKTATGGTLFVVVENHMGWWVACSVVDGVLQTYWDMEEAEAEADRIMADLGVESGWFGCRLDEAELGDNVRLIALPE